MDPEEISDLKTHSMHFESRSFDPSARSDPDKLFQLTNIDASPQYSDYFVQGIGQLRKQRIEHANKKV